jgi:hypothetical protein
MKAIATSGSAAPIGGAATNFATTASLANMFVKAFNTFQSGNVNSIQNPLTSFLDSSLLDAMGGVLADSGNNLLESLSKIGITLDTSLSADNTVQSGYCRFAEGIRQCTACHSDPADPGFTGVGTDRNHADCAEPKSDKCRASNAVVDNSVSSTSFANVAATAAGVVTSVAEPVASTHMLVQETVAANTADTTAGQSSEVGKNSASDISGRSSYVCANCGCQCSVFRI